jgi:thiol:disulfide interchange protein DsbD
MRILFALFALLFANTLPLSAHQLIQKVHWTAQVKKINASTYDIVFTAQIDKGWALYSQNLERKDGPLPTTFIFQKDKSYQKQGVVKESWKNKKKGYDPVFGMEVVKYEKSAVFTQRITTQSQPTIIVMIEYMTCSSTSCLPERYVEFTIDLNKVGQTIQPSDFVE